MFDANIYSITILPIHILTDPNLALPYRGEEESEMGIASSFVFPGVLSTEIGYWGFLALQK
jgi:hypothetical protein